VRSRHSYFTWCVIAAALFMSGCRPRKSNGRVAQRHLVQEQIRGDGVHGAESLVGMRPFVDLSEAKLVDVPIPLGAQVLQSSEGDDGVGSRDSSFLLYRTSMAADELEQFYLQQMEQMGWQQAHLFHGPELLINFEKPDRRCAISVRPLARESSEVALFLSSDTGERMLEDEGD